MTGLYATAVRDELWLHGVRAESRLSHGTARQEGETIMAAGAADPLLVAHVDAQMSALRSFLGELGDARVRLVAEALRDGGEERHTATITVTLGGVSIVTTPESVLADFADLEARLALPGWSDPPAVLFGSDEEGDEGRVIRERCPIVWRNGTASVLLHEAIGHAAEHGHPAVGWPSWLHADIPLRLRRATFRDVPLPRMTNVVITQTGAPSALPDDGIEVHLVAGGAYEPLTEMVTLEIAVATWRGKRLPRFTFRRKRSDIATSMAGASGQPLRYPGVICSREGQELVVGSYAPLLVTR